jgi:hypothetical protein
MASANTNDVTSYTVVAARAEIKDLLAEKLDLEAKLTEARRENQVITAEAHLTERNIMLAGRQSPSRSARPPRWRRKLHRSAPGSSTSKMRSSSRRVSTRWTM